MWCSCGVCGGLVVEGTHCKALGMVCCVGEPLALKCALVVVDNGCVLKGRWSAWGRWGSSDWYS